MFPRRAGTALAALLIALPANALAEPPSELAVSLSVDACAEVDAAEVRRLFTLELGTSVPDAIETDDDAAIRVDVTCDGALVQLRVEDPLTGKSLSRRISLGDKGRERLLALAVMELLVASWIELEATPVPEVEPADRRSAVGARTSARRIATRRLPPPAPRWRTTTSVVGALVASSPGMHGGAGLRIVFDAPNGFGWAADLIAESTSETLDQGTVNVSTLAAGLSVHAHRDWRALRMRGAAGARVGAATLSGDPSGPGVVGSSVTGLEGGPFGRATLGVEPVRHLSFGLSAELGYHLFSVSGFVDGAEQTSVEGAWLAAQLSAGWVW
jgi:hypothetical protein